MLMQGQSIHLQRLEDGIAELVIDLRHDTVNKFSQKTLAEVRKAIALIQQQADLTGLLITSAKDDFIVGADITEFTQLFNHTPERIEASLIEMNQVFNTLEDLPVPTVVAINGIAFGGGFELCLTTDYRVMAENARVGLPEVKLGINPGWGGTVRLPRLIGVDNANEWIAGGLEKTAAEAFRDGAADAVVPLELLREAALDLLHKCIKGEFDYQARRAEKTSPVKLNALEQMMAFESALGVVAAKAGKHYPAPVQAVKTMQKSAPLGRDKALAVEARHFGQLATNAVTAALVGIFLNDQHLKRAAKQYAKDARPVQQAAVLGAGIMGGGVAYQSASRSIPILMKDINPDALALGQAEATKLLQGQLKRGRIDAAEMAAVLNRIIPTLSYGDFGNVSIVVEAVVENPGIKKKVLAEVESQLGEDAILTSNTSTISITELASVLQHPERFCGMHFFNPVHRMPLVEVIRGQQTGEAAIARTVAYAQAMGKKPVVVNDCPGFLVNRILLPYFGGFARLLADGADFHQVDKVMENYGWPMGPAYLLDVVGIDTAHHADSVMAAGFPDRMAHAGTNAIDRMFERKRYGQKNGKGFYRYAEDRKGKPLKLEDEEVGRLLADVVGSPREFSDETIVERMMIPLCIEAVRCLEEHIAGSPAEVDMALVYGIGFPPFRGGVFHYLDRIGMQAFCTMAAQYADLGPLYTPTPNMLERATTGERYQPQNGGTHA